MVGGHEPLVESVHGRDHADPRWIELEVGGHGFPTRAKMDCTTMWSIDRHDGNSLTRKDLVVVGLSLIGRPEDVVDADGELILRGSDLRRRTRSNAGRWLHR